MLDSRQILSRKKTDYSESGEKICNAMLSKRPLRKKHSKKGLVMSREQRYPR